MIDKMLQGASTKLPIYHRKLSVNILNGIDLSKRKNTYGYGYGKKYGYGYGKHYGYGYGYGYGFEAENKKRK